MSGATNRGFWEVWKKRRERVLWLEGSQGGDMCSCSWPVDKGLQEDRGRSDALSSRSPTGSRQGEFRPCLKPAWGTTGQGTWWERSYFPCHQNSPKSWLTKMLRKTDLEVVCDPPQPVLKHSTEACPGPSASNFPFPVASKHCRYEGHFFLSQVYHKEYFLILTNSHSRILMVLNLAIWHNH